MTCSSCITTVPVYVVGLGQVGRRLVQNLLEAATVHAQIFHVQFRIRGLFDSSGSVVDPDSPNGLDANTIQSIVKWKQSGHMLKDFEQGVASKADSLIGTIEKNAIIVDTTATDATVPLLLATTSVGAGVVLANKKPITVSSSVFEKLTSSRGSLGIESTVGAGTPVIACLDRLLASGDKIKFIEGSLSGTLGFLMTELENGKPFSAAVEEAYNLGYTEPDPRDDLSGIDVARKALILTRKCGVTNIEMEDIALEPLYHSGLQKLSVPEFLEALSGLDGNFNHKIAVATDNGCVLRYVARIEFDYSKTTVAAKISVGLQEVPISSPLGSLSGTDNLVAFTTSVYDSSPLVVRGKGAGVEVTAAGVVADMVQISRYNQN